MHSGTVKWFNATKGYGFITPLGGGNDVFVHAYEVQLAGLRELSAGQQIRFDVVPDTRAQRAAANLQAP